MHETDSVENVSLEALLSRVTEDFLSRLNRGEHPDVEDYARRFRQLATMLRQVLPALEAFRSSLGEVCHGDDEARLQARSCLGDYRIVREVGRGGMGVVYEAEQLSLAQLSLEPIWRQWHETKTILVRNLAPVAPEGVVARSRSNSRFLGFPSRHVLRLGSSLHAAVER
jgi:hypothetical protein